MRSDKKKGLVGRAAIPLVIAIFIGVSLITVIHITEARGAPRLIYEKNSLYHQILVYREGSVVSMRFNRRADVVQSLVDTRNLRKHLLEYSQLAFCYLLYRPEPKRVLILGLGGGVIPRETRHYFPGAEIDAVEIDPEVLKAARDYFCFKTDDKLSAHVMDGRMFVRKLIRKRDSKKYDVIMLDAFLSDYIPFHLMTKEFLEQVKQVLVEDGVVVANVFYNNRLFDSEFKTFIEVFGRCQIYYGDRSGNAMIVAPGAKAKVITKAEALKSAKELQTRHEFSFSLPFVAGRLRPNAAPRDGAVVLTDDKAPVNKLRSRRN
jgi:spermidine synthase